MSLFLSSGFVFRFSEKKQLREVRIQRMEPIEFKLQLLREIFGNAAIQDLRDPTSPIWGAYDNFHALTGFQGHVSPSL